VPGRASGLRGVAGVAALAAAVLWGAAASAFGATAVAPVRDARVTAATATLRWTLAPGEYTGCVELSRSSAVVADGAFTDPLESGCAGPYSVATSMAVTVDGLGAYYWHVQTRRETCDADGACTWTAAYGPVAAFDSVEPPAPAGCTPDAAAALAQTVLLPDAQRRPSARVRALASRLWEVSGPLCRDLTGDGDREMVVRLRPAPGGGATETPWAIFRHDRTGAWRLAYARFGDPVTRLRASRAGVRTTLTGCRTWVVVWDGRRFATRGRGTADRC
jgi:hypothetical protein